MRPQVSVYIATSLDGFIARPDGGLDWLPGTDEAGAAPEDAPHEDYGYAAFMAGVDALVMGRGSFDAVLGFPSWPYAGTRVVVLSRTLERVPARGAGGAEVPAGEVEVSMEAPAALLARLHGEGVRRVYLDGGATIRSFLREGLVDDMILTRVPCLLGAGIPLFGDPDAPGDVLLEHVRTDAYPSGLVQSEYRVRRDGP